MREEEGSENKLLEKCTQPINWKQTNKHINI